MIKYTVNKVDYELVQGLHVANLEELGRFDTEDEAYEFMDLQEVEVYVKCQVDEVWIDDTLV